MAKQFNRGLAAICLAADAIFSRIPAFANKKRVLIACLPKSGSTFLATALSSLDGFRRVRLIPDWDGREQELCPIRLSRYNYASYISQHHIRYSTTTERLIKKYNLTPVVQVRNLADCMISLRDYVRKDDGQSPHIYITQAQKQLPDDELELLLIKMILPWYINFYLGWKNYGRAMIVDYDDLNQNPALVLNDIAQFVGIETNIEACHDVLQKAQSSYTRKNKGVIGRGAELSLAARREIGAMLDLYPEFKDDTLFVKTRGTLGR